MEELRSPRSTQPRLASRTAAAVLGALIVVLGPAEATAWTSVESTSASGAGVALPAASKPKPKKKPKKKRPYQNPTAGRELVLQIKDMHRAQVRRDIVYQTVAGNEFRMNVYRPRGAAVGSRLPAVLLGGPPGAGRATGQKIGWSQVLAASGLAAVSFDIRSDDFQASPREPSLDVAAAIAFVRSHADELGLDRDRLCMFGFSIGTAPWNLWAAMREPAPYIRCNVVYYGVLDFTAGEFSIDPALAAEFSAITYLRRDGARIAPMLVAKAGQERFPAINRGIDRFVAEARAVGAPVELVTHPSGVHGFDIFNNDTRSRAIIRRTIAFFRERLSGS